MNTVAFIQGFLVTELEVQLWERKRESYYLQRILLTTKNPREINEKLLGPIKRI